MCKFRNNLLLMNFFLLLLLNVGYMHLRIPQVQIGIPISEWLLLLTLLTTANLRLLGRIRDPTLLFPYILWLSYGSILIIFGFFEHGIRAVRDGLPVIEALFLYAGFVFADDQRSVAALARWLPKVLAIGVVYCCLHAFKNVITDISPTVTGIQGQDVPLLIHFASTAMLMVVAAAYALDRYRQRNTWSYLVFAATAIALPLIFLPSRTLFLTISVLVAYFLASSSKNHIPGIVSTIVIGTIIFLGLIALDFESTRLGLSNLTDYKALFIEIFPGMESAQSISSGTSTRLQWWSDIFEQLGSSWSHLVFGLGYGIPLTDLIVEQDVIVYTPHNTIVSVLGRGGLIAGLAFISLHLVIDSLEVWCWVHVPH